MHSDLIGQLSLLFERLNDLFDADEPVPPGEVVAVLEEHAVVSDHPVGEVGEVAFGGRHDVAGYRRAVGQVQGPQRGLHFAQYLDESGTVSNFRQNN